METRYPVLFRKVNYIKNFHPPHKGLYRIGTATNMSYGGDDVFLLYFFSDNKVISLTIKKRFLWMRTC